MAFPWMGKQLDCVAFDMDGTLLNSGEFGARAIRLAFESMMAAGELPGLDAPPTEDAIRAQIGKPPYVFYAELLPEPLKHKAMDLHRAASANEKQFLNDGSGKLFDGGRDVLVELKGRGLKLLLVSNCSQDYLDAVVETFVLDELLDFRAAAGRSQDVSKPGELQRGLNELGLKTGIMVGDRVHDGDAAKACGLWFIGCTYGYGPRTELSSADALVDDIRQLPPLLA
ncbi:MAG: HAD family hydrolase [Planctomycetes bacterium]|nr:HAD family hydrolase [Planctomycetota bacterium]